MFTLLMDGEQFSRVVTFNNDPIFYFRGDSVYEESFTGDEGCYTPDDRLVFWCIVDDGEKEDAVKMDHSIKLFDRFGNLIFEKRPLYYEVRDLDFSLEDKD